MAQRSATPQGTKRRYPDFSPPALQGEKPESRRPPYPPPGAMAPPSSIIPPSSMGGLQAPQVGVAVVTIDMFREYQRHVAISFEQQSKQITLLQERVQSFEGRIQSLEDAEDLAIDAMREIHNSLIPRVNQHDEDLNTLNVTITRQNTIVETLGSLGQEFRTNQSRDVMRPNQPAWRPGPLGGLSDQSKNGVDEMKAQLTRSLAGLAEHDRRLGETDARLAAHDAHLTSHERRAGEHERLLGDHGTRLAAQDRLFTEQDGRLKSHETHLKKHDLCVANHADRLGVADTTNDQLRGRLFALEQRMEHGLSPAQITQLIQNHHQHLESLEKNLQQHIEASREAQAERPSSPRSQSSSTHGEMRTLVRRVGSENNNPQEQRGTGMPRNGQDAVPHDHREIIDRILGLEKIVEHLATMDKRITPLEQRIYSIEKRSERSEKSEKSSQPATTPESMMKDSTAEDEGQYEILRRTDFQREKDLAGLRSNEDSQLLMQLFSDKDKCDDACYTVQRACVHMWSYLLCRSRKDERIISDFWKRKDWLNYPSILELERNASMPKGKYFPRFVYEIGEVFNRRVVTKYNGRQATHRSTGYHLVVDVTKPEKSIWLVYRYQEESNDGQNLKQSITYKQDQFWHPFAGVCEYDIAMVFERFEDWKGTDTPVGSYMASKKLVRQTAALIRPTFIEPVLQELKDEIRRSWEANGKERVPEW